MLASLHPLEQLWGSCSHSPSKNTLEQNTHSLFQHSRSCKRGTRNRGTQESGRAPLLVLVLSNAVDKRDGPAAVYWMTSLFLEAACEDVPLKHGTQAMKAASLANKRTAGCRRARREAAYGRGLEQGKVTKATSSFLQHLDAHLVNAMTTRVDISGRCRELEQQQNHDIEPGVTSASG